MLYQSEHIADFVAGDILRILQEALQNEIPTLQHCNEEVNGYAKHLFVAFSIQYSQHKMPE